LKLVVLNVVNLERIRKVAWSNGPTYIRKWHRTDFLWKSVYGKRFRSTAY